LGKQHPEAKTKEGKKLLGKEITYHLPDVLANLERMKPHIEKEYVQWEAAEAERKQSSDKQREERTHSKSRSQTSYEKYASRDPTLSSRGRLLDASEHQDLAVDLAQREMRRRDADRRATRQAGISIEEEQHRRTAGFWDNWTEDLVGAQATDEKTFRNQMESTRRKANGGDDDHIHSFVQKMSRAERERDAMSGPSVSIPAGGSRTYYYPSIARSEPVTYESQPARSQSDDLPQPPRPPKAALSESLYGQSLASAPAIPAKDPIYAILTPENSQTRPDRPPKISDEPSPPPAKKQRLTFKPTAYLENGDPIRSLFLPSKLREDFVSLAADNTRRNLEMCGVLCGTAVNNALFVKCLVIPEQKCTPDTCETINEGALFDFCMSEDLLQLGWIHTHPTQSCFMSSRDLHTQSGYQVMLPESIAVVCAPKYEPS
jgi:STAM-binding protein